MGSVCEEGMDGMVGGREDCATVENDYARSRTRLGIGQSMTYLRRLQTSFPRLSQPCMSY